MPVSAFTWEEQPEDAEKVTVCNGFDCWFPANEEGESGLNLFWWPVQLFFFPIFLLWTLLVYIFTGFFPDLFYAIYLLYHNINRVTAEWIALGPGFWLVFLTFYCFFWAFVIVILAAIAYFITITLLMLEEDGEQVSKFSIETYTVTVDTIIMIIYDTDEFINYVLENYPIWWEDFLQWCLDVLIWLTTWNDNPDGSKRNKGRTMYAGKNRDPDESDSATVEMEDISS